MNQFQQGKLEATEQIVSLVYERYCFFRIFYGKDSEQALMVKNLIHSIRDMQTQDLQEEENE